MVQSCSTIDDLFNQSEVQGKVSPFFSCCSRSGVCRRTGVSLLTALHRSERDDEIEVVMTGGDDACIAFARVKDCGRVPTPAIERRLRLVSTPGASA